MFRGPASDHGGVLRFWEHRLDDVIGRLDHMRVAELTAWEMLADVHKQVVVSDTEAGSKWVRQQLQWLCSEIRSRRRRRAVRLMKGFNQAGVDPNAQSDAVNNLFALAFPLLCRRWIPTGFFDIEHPAWHADRLLNYFVPVRGIDESETLGLTEVYRDNGESNRLNAVFDAMVELSTRQLEASDVALNNHVSDNTRKFLGAATREGRNGEGSWCKTRFPYVTGNAVDAAVMLDVIVSVRPYEREDQGAALNTLTDADMDDDFFRAIRDDAALTAFKFFGKGATEFETSIYLDDFPGGVTYPARGSQNGQFQLKDGSAWLASALALGHGAMGAISHTPLDETECGAVLATGVVGRQSRVSAVGSVSHIGEKSMAARHWDADFYLPITEAKEAQDRRRSIGGGRNGVDFETRGVSDYGEALKAWNPAEPQSWAKPTIWWEIGVFAMSVLAVVLLGLGLRLDIVAEARLLLAVSGFIALVPSAFIVGQRLINLRVARKFKSRWVEDITSGLFVLMSLTAWLAVWLTLFENSRYWAQDALDLEILMGQLAATLLMVLGRRS
ncbi:MAG: hypothetical protein QF898_08505 [SAR202 cluster bacterium]|nr:hypothetical protein [SAR202 cluster bacterium]MDP6714870.1 hypothetical protein [SAR202 cluster bacterium]